MWLCNNRPLGGGGLMGLYTSIFHVLFPTPHFHICSSENSTVQGHRVAWLNEERRGGHLTLPNFPSLYLTYIMIYRIHCDTVSPRLQFLIKYSHSDFNINMLNYITLLIRQKIKLTGLAIPIFKKFTGYLIWSSVKCSAILKYIGWGLNEIFALVRDYLLSPAQFILLTYCTPKDIATPTILGHMHDIADLFMWMIGFSSVDSLPFR